MYLLRLSPVLLLALLLLTIGACKKMVSYEGPPPEPNILVQIVETSIQGRVLNEKLQPVQGATVSAGGETTTTDINGHFLLDSISVPDDATVVSVQKSGYFTGYRTLLVREGHQQYIQLELLLENENDVSGTNGGLIAFPEGTLSIPPDGVQTAGNQPFGAAVTVRSIYINADGNTFADQMPGDLRGMDKTNKQVGLRAFSMIHFEMEDDAGATLQPDPAKQVGFRIKIPVDLSTEAPQQIALWHFDNASGFWKEEGQATRQGDDYIGTVPKAGTWLCATTFPEITLTAGVVDENGAPIANMRVTVMTKIGFISVYGFTAADGSYYGKAPSNEPLLMVITDNCNNVLHQQEIGPFNANSEINDVPVTIPEANTLTVTGTAKDCDNFNVVTGKVIINVDGQNYAANINLGKFNATIIRCSNVAANVSFTATDDRTGKTAVTTMNANTGTITPTLVVCD